MIFFANPQEQFKSYKQEIENAVLKVLSSKNFILGSEVNSLEKEFAEYIGANFSIGVANGTDAIEISLRALNIGKGDEVITVSHTAVATVSAIESSGATPILVDIEEDFFTLDINKLDEVVSKKTRAIICVHLYGQPGNIIKIRDYCKKNDLYLIEDVSQAHGSTFKNIKLGLFGDISCFSCYPTKNLGAIGDAGLIVTNNEKHAKNIKAIREYGWQTKRYLSDLVGRNSRMDEIQAAILRIKLKNLDKDNLKRIRIAKIYSDHLRDKDLILPKLRKDSLHVFHLYVIRSRERDKLLNFLKEKEIFAGIHYPFPIHKQPAYKKRFKTSESMLVTEIASKEVLSLPIYPELNDNDIDYILEMFTLFLSKK
tara:strand:- start:185 stop:1291 length:1107 start_codon:yes stop_codon:yes gene_type:complete